MQRPLSALLITISFCMSNALLAQNQPKPAENEAKETTIPNETEQAKVHEEGATKIDERTEVDQQALIEKGVPNNTENLDPEAQLESLENSIVVPEDLVLRKQLALENGLLPPDGGDGESLSFYNEATGSINFIDSVKHLNDEGQEKLGKLVNFYNRARTNSVLDLRSESSKSIEESYTKWEENGEYGRHLIVGIDVAHFAETLGTKTKNSANLNLKEINVYEEETSVYTNAFIDSLHEISIKIGLHELDCNNMTYQKLKEKNLSIFEVKVNDIEGAYVQLICTSNKNPDIYRQLNQKGKEENKQTAWYITHYGLGKDTTIESKHIKRYLPHHSNAYSSSDYLADESIDFITGAVNSPYYLAKVLEEYFNLELETLQNSIITETEGKLAAYKSHRAKVNRQYKLLLDNIAANLDILRHNYVVSEESIDKIQLPTKDQSKARATAYRLSNSLLKYHNTIQNSSLKFLYDPTTHFSEEATDEDVVRSQLENVRDRWSPTSQVYELTQFATEVFFNINELFEAGGDSLETISKQYMDDANEIIQRIDLCYEECATEYQPGIKDPSVEVREKLRLRQEAKQVDDYILTVQEEFVLLREKFIEDSKNSTLRHILPDGTTVFWAYEDYFTHHDLTYFLAAGGGITGLTDEFESRLFQEIENYHYDSNKTPLNVISKLEDSYTNQKTNLEIRTLPYQIIMTVQKNTETNSIVPLMTIKIVDQEDHFPNEKEIYSLASHIEMGLSQIDVKEVEALIENLEVYLGKLEERLNEIKNGEVKLYNKERRSDETVNVEPENIVVATNLLKELNLIKDYYTKVLGMNDTNYANFLSEMSFYLNQSPSMRKEESTGKDEGQELEDKPNLDQAMAEYEKEEDTIQSMLLAEVKKVKEGGGNYSIDRDKVLSIIYSKEFNDLDRVKWAAFQVYTHKHIDQLDIVQQALALDTQWFFSQI
ncbi:hypothetical protein N9N67_04820 [Bacteriovoracaceae bacterium]|nr:hypothetical protein [Bacteriovoracaceae bacterium]